MKDILDALARIAVPSSASCVFCEAVKRELHQY